MKTKAFEPPTANPRVGDKKRREIEGVIRLLLINCASSSYAQRILDEIIDDVVRDVDESADPTDWNDDDVRLACGRVLLERIQLYQQF